MPVRSGVRLLWLSHLIQVKKKGELSRYLLRLTSECKHPWLKDCKSLLHEQKKYALPASEIHVHHKRMGITSYFAQYKEQNGANCSNLLHDWVEAHGQQQSHHQSKLHSSMAFGQHCFLNRYRVQRLLTEALPKDYSCHPEVLMPRLVCRKLNEI